MTAWTYYQGEWQTGNPPIMGPMTHAAWLGSAVFDGARAFEGTAPDLDLHCERVVGSARAMGLVPSRPAGEILELVAEGIAKHPKGTALYIRPMFWGTTGFVVPDPESTDFCLTVYENPMPDPSGFSLTVSPFRRPSIEVAPTDAKAACLYPNSARAMVEARGRGFDNAIMLDALGAVSELCTSNIWMARDGVALTPVPNGSFLNGITRQRIIVLLRQAGVKVVETQLRVEDFHEADEIFNTGNYGKLMPVTRFETRDLQPGPIYARARELYWDYAHTKAAL
ncbi:Branched-chain amino acid aminotransferase [hydrothermal vent metagenome]|uniref:Branched-chain amino acid aminotransferase n=1 Tax=hydrothermal vent metagenome TaxID=652676 RepID=A0A3B0T2L3_9ZZZZ